MNVLVGALERLDPTFTCAETSLRVYLAVALSSTGEYGGTCAYAERAEDLAAEIGSV